MTMKMRVPMLIATGMAAILMAANAPREHHDRQQNGPRPGQECAPTDLNPNDARYTCPQNHSAEQPKPRTSTNS
jgi:hypothetical protein